MWGKAAACIRDPPGTSPAEGFPRDRFFAGLLRAFPGRRDLPQTLLPLSETGWGLHLRGKMFFSPFFTKEGFSFILEM